MKGFIYEQRTGILAIRNGDFECPLFDCFAGNQDGRNNPQMERVVLIGPLPRGFYRMRVVPHPRFRFPAIKLDWLETLNKAAGLDIFGRSGFYVHGGTESHGCIVLNNPARGTLPSLIDCGYDLLEVIA